jgi:hypothetical protein
LIFFGSGIDGFFGFGTLKKMAKIREKLEN